LKQLCTAKGPNAAGNDVLNILGSKIKRSRRRFDNDGDLFI